jgi:hypothetical protein
MGKTSSEERLTPREFLSIDEVAQILGVSTATATRQFEFAEGVIDIGTAGSLHRRRKRLLRVPRRTLDRYIVERRVRR